MKKLLCLVLAVLLLLLTACSGGQMQSQTQTQMTTGSAETQSCFRVGYAKGIITPEEDVPLRGYGNTSMRISNGYWDELYATCTAMTDESGNTVLMFSMDLANSPSIIPAIRQAVSEATGVPYSNVLFSATHTHSAPDLESSLPSIPRYTALLLDRVRQTALEAMEDRKPATMYINTVQTENLNFVRRYILENGEAAGDNYGDFSASPIARHESEADGSMQLVKFVREGGKDVIMANFQTHPHRAGGSSKLYMTADIVGAFRDKMEAELDCNFIYFTGASGNINPTSRIKEENITTDYLTQGQALADHAIAANDSYTQAQTGTVQTVERTVTLEVNHEKEEQLNIAKQILSLWNSSNNYDACARMGEPYGINSPYHANSIVSRAALGETMDIQIHAFSIGDLAFVTAPYEMFDSNGLQIKEGSPFTMTFVATLANDNYGYIPSQLGWENGGYCADMTRFGRGSAEILVEQYLQMLQELYPTK